MALLGHLPWTSQLGRSLFHLVFLGAFGYAARFDWKNVPAQALPISGKWWSRAMFLTLINLYIDVIYHAAGVLIALFGVQANWVRQWHFLGRTVVGPLGLSVTALFWSLWWFDPASVASNALAQQLLSIVWYNNALHTLPAVSALLDLRFWNHGKFPADRAARAIAIFVAVYLIDIHLFYWYSGIWAYPVLAQLPIWGRGIFFVAAGSLIFAAYWALSQVNDRIWGGRIKRN